MQRISLHDTTEPIRCPICRAPMALVRVAPSFAGLPEMRTYKCTQCGHVENRPAEE